MKGLSDPNLQRLWRRKSKEIHNNCCFFCGKHESQTELEVHHYIKRSVLLTKYLAINGFPCCRYDCHQFAHTKKGTRQIEDWLAKNGWLDYLQERETSSKQWFVDHHITRNDYLKKMYDELKGIIKK